MLTEIGLGAGYIIGNVERKQEDEGESEEFIVMILECSKKKCYLNKNKVCHLKKEIKCISELHSIAPCPR